MSEPACPRLEAATSGEPTEFRIETPRETPLSDALALWRREAQHGTFQTERYRCRYFAWGDGPPLVFIHGLCDRARSFVPVMEKLCREFRCIGYELPGGGGDGARLGQYRHSDLVSDLFEFLELLATRQAYLFGSSFGSTIALAAMTAHPERIPRGVLQGAFAWRPLVGWQRLACLFLRYGRGLMGTLPLRDHLHPRAEHAIFLEHHKAELWAFLVSNSNDVSKAAAARRGLMLEHVDLRSQLPRIRQPILMISGDRDSLVPKSCDESLVNGLPSVARVEIPNCGHYPQYTHAALTAELTRQFLTAPVCVS